MLDNLHLVFLIAEDPGDLFLFDGFGAGILLYPSPAEDLGPDHDPLHAGRNPKGCILHGSRLLPKNRPEKFFFRGRLGLSFGSNLSHEDVPGLDLRPNPDNTALVEVP